MGANLPLTEGVVMQQDKNDPSGVSGNGHGSKEVTRARDRKANAALALKLGGATWDEIAEMVGYPTGRAALVAVENVLGKQLREMDRLHLRALAAGRLESLVRSAWRKAHTESDPEHLAAIKTVRENVESISRLWGLQAPQEILITNPTQEHLDRWVAQVVSQNLPQVAEADVVEADIVSDTDDDMGEAV